jgi:hypothetical protein
MHNGIKAFSIWQIWYGIYNRKMWNGYAMVSYILWTLIPIGIYNIYGVNKALIDYAFFI